ncbi:alginate export family protein, partial [Fibrobacterota bacterium]
EKVKLFAEGLDAREWAFHTPEKGQKDPLDLHQAFIEFSDIAHLDLNMKAGRQTFSYGKKRLVAAPVWGNKVRSFDAVLLGVKMKNLESEVFFGSRVIYEESGFNKSKWEKVFAGTYNTITVDAGTLVDVYLLGLVDRENDDGRYTLGTRFNHRKLPGTEIDAEAAWQWGENQGKEIRAYAGAFYVQKKLERKFSPQAKLEANIASGDRDNTDNADGTFSSLYQAVHGQNGIIDFFRWQNLRELAGVFCITLSKQIKAQPEAHWYWLDSGADAWYRSTGKALWSNPEYAGNLFAGSEYTLIVKYTFNRHLKGDAGYSFFHSGNVAGTAGDRDGVHFIYGQAITVF